MAWISAVFPITKKEHIAANGGLFVSDFAHFLEVNFWKSVYRPKSKKVTLWPISGKNRPRSIIFYILTHIDLSLSQYLHFYSQSIVL